MQRGDYPERRQHLQLDLHGVAMVRGTWVPPIEVALWVLDERAGRFLTQARPELDPARRNGSADRLNRRRRKRGGSTCCGSAPPEEPRNAWLRDANTEPAVHPPQSQNTASDFSDTQPRPTLTPYPHHPSGHSGPTPHGAPPAWTSPRHHRQAPSCATTSLRQGWGLIATQRER